MHNSRNWSHLMFVPMDQYQATKLYQSCLNCCWLITYTVKQSSTWPTVDIPAWFFLWDCYTAGVVSHSPGRRRRRCHSLLTVQAVCSFKYGWPQHIATTIVIINCNGLALWRFQTYLSRPQKWVTLQLVSPHVQMTSWARFNPIDASSIQIIWSYLFWFQGNSASTGHNRHNCAPNSDGSISGFQFWYDIYQMSRYRYDIDISISFSIYR